MARLFPEYCEHELDSNEQELTGDQECDQLAQYYCAVCEVVRCPDHCLQHIGDSERPCAMSKFYSAPARVRFGRGYQQRTLIVLHQIGKLWLTQQDDIHSRREIDLVDIECSVDGEDITLRVKGQTTVLRTRNNSYWSNLIMNAVTAAKEALEDDREDEEERKELAKQGRKEMFFAGNAKMEAEEDSDWEMTAYLPGPAADAAELSSDDE